ncbi:MAG: hypothetical protein RIC52_12930, partial [Amphiplicatus sp.]
SKRRKCVAFIAAFFEFSKQTSPFSMKIPSFRRHHPQARGDLFEGERDRTSTKQSGKPCERNS